MVNELLEQIRSARYCSSIAYCGNCVDTEVSKKLAPFLRRDPSLVEQIYQEAVRSERQLRAKMLKCFAHAGDALGDRADAILELAWSSYHKGDNPSLEIISGIGSERIDVVEAVLEYLEPTQPEWMYVVGSGVWIDHKEAVSKYPYLFDEAGSLDNGKLRQERERHPVLYRTDLNQQRRADAINGAMFFQGFAELAVPAVAAAWDVFKEYDPDMCYGDGVHERICKSLKSFGKSAVLALPVLRMELERCLDSFPGIQCSSVGPCEVIAEIGPDAAEVLPLLIELAKRQGYDPDVGKEFYYFSDADPLARAICVLRGHNPQDYV